MKRARLVLAVAAALLPAFHALAVPVVRPTVVAVHPHDPGAFTEGLVFAGGVLYESTGNYGESNVRRVDAATGTVLRLVPLPLTEYGEGLALVGGVLKVITYFDGVGHVYDPLTLDELGGFNYTGEAWGMSFDGTHLLVSNGSSELTLRDPASFVRIGSLAVTVDGSPVLGLNEIECVGELVYANVFRTNTILRIDGRSGAALTAIDASDLLTPAERQSAGVLNGIAFDPATHHFFLTGKYWPKVFEVTFPFDPYGEPACDPGSLVAATDLHCRKAPGGGVRLAWSGGGGGRGYHVNAVPAAADLAGARPHRPGLAGGVGEARCDAAAGVTSCVDLAALADPRPLLFFQVFPACGPAGIDEGP